MTTLRAFHGQQAIKDQYIARMTAHKLADEIVQGKYWEAGKGCAVGCTIHGSDHSRYESELGIPAEIAVLEDVIFERFSNGDAKDFPLNFLNAIPVGADLSKVFDQFVLWLLEDKEYGFMAIGIFTEEPEFADAISVLRDIYHRRLAGETITEEQYEVAQTVVNRALDRALALARARDLARARARDLARDLARARVLALARALALALDRALARALDLDREEINKAWATKLLELLAEAPVPQEA